MPDTLHLRLLGGLTTTLGTSPSPLRFPSTRAELFLAYLALNPSPHSREELADFLWDDRPRKQALSNLRSLLAQLPDEVKPYLLTDRQNICINPALPIWVDAREFAQQTAAPTTSTQLASALQLYQGDFLEGVFARESHGLEEWGALWRERLRHTAQQAHLQLAEEGLYQRQYELGIQHGRLALQLDPFNETAVRLLLRLLARAGQRNAALLHYQNFRHLLAEEMGIPPTAETIQLNDRIRLARQPIPHQLPIPPTPFIGRESELATLETLLDQPATRLISIVGLGGSGKTRLATHVADGRRGEYLNGIHFIALAGVEDHAYLPTSLATQLDVPLQSSAPALPQLLAHLREQELLLILDNLEHLAAKGTALVAQLLTAAPDVTLIVTSREPLGLPQEQIVPLTGLPLADAADPAGRLFEQCAQRSQVEFVYQGEVATAVQQICHAVEGLPLAIELAAALLPQQPIQRIAAEIQHTLANLTTRWRDIPTRHRSLTATFDYSWNLLTAEEQAVLAGLALFRQPFEAVAAAQIARATPALLGQLVRKSLVQPQGESSYQLLAMVRQFAQDKLEERGELAAVAANHGRYHLHFLATQETLLNGAELPAALQAIAPKLQEFRAAWQWGIQQEAWPLLEGACESLALFFEAKGWTFEGLTWFSETVAALPATAPPLLHGRLLSWLGYCQERTGQLPEAQATLTASLALLHTHPRWEAFAQKHLGSVAYAQGLHEQAAEHFHTALALYEEVAFAPGISSTLTHLAHLQVATGEIVQSEAFAQRSLALAQEMGNPRDAAIALAVLGQLAERGGDYGRAQAIYRDNLALCQQIGDVMGLAYGHHRLGNLVRQLGQLAEAQTHYEAGLEQAERLHDPWWRALFAVRLGNLAQEQLAYGEAQRLYHEARHLCEQMGDRRGIAITELHLGTTATALGHEAAAFAHLMASLETASAIQFMPIVLEALLRLAQREQEQWPSPLLAQVVAFVRSHPATDAAWEPALAALVERIPPTLWQMAVAAYHPDQLAELVTAVRP